jgi:hypothetical protein
LQLNRDSSLTGVALTITHLLEKNLVTTYDAEKILWALLGSVYLYEVEEGKRSKYEIVNMIEAQEGVALKRVFEDGGCKRWLIKKNKERVTNVTNLLQILYS